MLDKLLAAFIFAMMPEPALAPPSIPVTTIVPVPDQYKGNAEVMVKFVHPWDVEIACHGFDIPNWVTYACYKKEGSEKKLILPNPCLFPEADNDESYAYLACHEKAHVNGWEH